MIGGSCAPPRAGPGDTLMSLSDHKPPGCRRTTFRKRPPGKYFCALRPRTSGSGCWRRSPPTISVTSRSTTWSHATSARWKRWAGSSVSKAIFLTGTTSASWNRCVPATSRRWTAETCSPASGLLKPVARNWRRARFWTRARCAVWPTRLTCSGKSPSGGKNRNILRHFLAWPN